MRSRAPFQAADLAELDDSLLARASAVVAMEDVHDGHRDPNAIGLRHDCDAGHSLATAVKIAAWEVARGYRSTFYLLHTSPYWTSPEFPAAVEQIAEYGHEIGIHADSLCEALRTGRDPDLILDEAIGKLRSLGHRVRGVAGHGNPMCNRDRGPGEITFAADEQFVECARPQEGAPDRTIIRGNISLKLAPRPLADFGLEYEALILAHTFGRKPFRISDSGGKWLNPGWEETVVKWQTQPHEQLHFLLHPDWWSQAFVPAEVAA